MPLWNNHHRFICFANNDPIEENDLGFLSKQCMDQFCPAVDNLDMWLTIEYYCHGSYNDPTQILYRRYTSSESSDQSTILKSSNHDIQTSRSAKHRSMNEYWLNKFLLALFYGFVSIAGIHCGLWYGRRLNKLCKESTGYKMISGSPSPYSYSSNNYILADVILIDRVETNTDYKAKEYDFQNVSDSRIVYGSSSNVENSTRKSYDNDNNYNSDDSFGVTIGRSYSSFFNSSHYSDDDGNDDDDDNGQRNQENASLLNRRKQQYKK